MFILLKDSLLCQLKDEIFKLIDYKPSYLINTIHSYTFSFQLFIESFLKTVIV